MILRMTLYFSSLSILVEGSDLSAVYTSFLFTIGIPYTPSCITMRVLYNYTSVIHKPLPACQHSQEKPEGLL